MLNDKKLIKISFFNKGNLIYETIVESQNIKEFQKIVPGEKNIIGYVLKKNQLI